MGLLSAVIAALKALTAYCTHVYPTKVQRELTRDIYESEQEIYRLGLVGDAAAKLRIEQIHKSKRRSIELLGALRPADSDTTTGPNLPI